MRTFTGIADSYLLGVIAGTALDATVTALERSTQANATMLRHYEEQASHFA